MSLFLCISVDGVLPGRRQDRKSASSAQKQQLKLLRKGDQITVEKMGIAEVSQIDIFTMKAYVIEPQEGKGKWVNASDIILKGRIFADTNKELSYWLITRSFFSLCQMVHHKILHYNVRYGHFNLWGL